MTVVRNKTDFSGYGIFTQYSIYRIFILFKSTKRQSLLQSSGWLLSHHFMLHDTARLVAGVS